MSKLDLVLLHPPSVYDFRTRAFMFGPISDVVPSGPIFEMYPIGFMTILGWLQRHGFSVRIINVALCMLKSRSFDVEKLIRSLDARAFGIDLHWLAHAQGSLELARIVKKYHPDTPVIFGGLSSSYYHAELLHYPQVDYVLRGDCAEEPLRMLLERIKGNAACDDIPNLAWRDSDGAVHANEIGHVPSDLGRFPFDYGSIIRSTLKHRDLRGCLPFSNWMAYPIVAILPWKGCVHNCITCGGSAGFYRNHCGRRQPAYRSPQCVSDNIRSAAAYLRGPIIVLGDIRQAGREYAAELLDRVAELRIKNHIALELFYPADKKFLEHIARSIANFNIEISPESHDEDVRRAFGRAYGNRELEQTIGDALGAGCKRIDLFFMTGLPKQTPQSVAGTVKYIETILSRFSEKYPKRILPYISPLAPFLDPGSAAFEQPEKYGYRLLCKTLEEHRRALLQSSWKYMLNYETEWMTRDEIVSATYDAALELNRVKTAYGIIGRREGERIEARTRRARKLVERIDAIQAQKDSRISGKQMALLHAEIRRLSDSTICRKDELQWPIGLMRFNPLAILKTVFSRPG
jgi:B12-binding domain/radical SAM domain protein